MKEDHVQNRRCAGEPLVYSVSSGTLYYRGADPKKLVSGSLFIRQERNVNAFVGGRSHREYIKYVDCDEPEKSYDLSELPLSSNGRVPLCRMRDFAPAEPHLPDGVEVIVVNHDLKSREELELLLVSVVAENANSEQSQSVEKTNENTQEPMLEEIADEMANEMVLRSVKGTFQYRY